MAWIPVASVQKVLSAPNSETLYDTIGAAFAGHIASGDEVITVCCKLVEKDMFSEEKLTAATAEQLVELCDLKLCEAHKVKQAYPTPAAV